MGTYPGGVTVAVVHTGVVTLVQPLSKERSVMSEEVVRGSNRINSELRHYNRTPD